MLRAYTIAQHVCITVLLTSLAACGPSISADESNLDENIELVATSRQQWTGVTIDKDQHLFVCYPNWSASHTLSVARLDLNTNNVIPFPDIPWNTWNETTNPATQFICVQAVFIDDHQNLWILDAANIQRDGKYQGVVKGGAKLVQFNLQTGAVLKLIVLDEPFIKSSSYLNEVRIDEAHEMAYITDAGEGALLVINLATGSIRRVLDTNAAVKSENKILTIEGAAYRNTQGEYPVIHANGIALNSDNNYLYWRPLTGESLYRIPTGFLNDPTVLPTTLEARIEKLGTFPPSDGMIFGYYNELYLASIEENAIRAYDHGNETRLIRQREDLKWPDTFTVSNNGYLYFTTSQLHLANPTEPYKLFRIPIPI